MFARRLLKIVGTSCLAGLAVLDRPYLFCSQKSDNVEDSYLTRWRKKIGLGYWFFPILHARAGTDDAAFNIKPWDWNWDEMHLHTSHDTSSNISGDASVHLKRSKCTRNLIFVRHGQYYYADDDFDAHLTDLGREQLDYTGMRLKHLNLPYKVLYYSTMTRAIESAEIILKHLTDVPAEPFDLLREGAPYPLEPPLPYYQPTAKELKEDGTRIENAFKKFVHRAKPDQSADSYEIFVCHANVIRYFVCRALQFPPEAWIRFSLDHGSITWIVIRPDGRVSLRWLGNSGYMPPDKISVQ